MQNLLNDFLENKEKIHVDLVHALSHGTFEDCEEVEILNDNMFKLKYDDCTRDLLMIVNYELGLAFQYIVNINKFVVGGVLVTAEVIGSHTNIYEIIGDGYGGLKLQVADAKFVFSNKEISL